MRYVLLLRGINVGGKNKVVMADLRKQVQALGFTRVATYINSGNLFFDSLKSVEDISAMFQAFFEQTYPFVTAFSLFNHEDYQADYLSLPAWWQGELARKDVLFYTEQVDRQLVKDRVAALPMGDELVHFGRLGVYWGKREEKNYLQTAYHKFLLKEPFYKQVTIRNGKTLEKIGEFLSR